MIQLLIFTGMIAIFHIEAIIIQAVSIQNADFQELLTLYRDSDNGMIMVNPSFTTDLFGPEVRTLPAE